MENREIYEVHAKVVDANGTFNNVTGYPKIFDSRNYDGDWKKAEHRALGSYHEALSDMCKIDSRRMQTAFVIRISDCVTIEKEIIYGDVE